MGSMGSVVVRKLMESMKICNYIRNTMPECKVEVDKTQKDLEELLHKIDGIEERK